MIHAKKNVFTCNFFVETDGDVRLLPTIRQCLKEEIVVSDSHGINLNNRHKIETSLSFASVFCMHKNKYYLY